MTHLINQERDRPIHRRRQLALLAAAALATLAPDPAVAGFRLSVSPAELADPDGRVRIRRQVAAAARALCDTGGLVAVYRDGNRRCRLQVVDDVDRQLRARRTARLLAR